MARNCPTCAAGPTLTRFHDETFAIQHAGAAASVPNLSGWRCNTCGEVEFEADSARRHAAAGDALVLRERQRQGARNSAASAASSA